MLVVQRIDHNVSQALPYILAIAITDSLDHQITQRALIEEHFSQDIEDLTTQGLTLFFQLLEQSMKNFAFACVQSDQIPEVANLCLTNTVNTPKTLL